MTAILKIRAFKVFIYGVLRGRWAGIYDRVASAIWLRGLREGMGLERGKAGACGNNVHLALSIIKALSLPKARGKGDSSHPDYRDP